jgi:hypothetical protein
VGSSRLERGDNDDFDWGGREEGGREHKRRRKPNKKKKKKSVAALDMGYYVDILCPVY